MARLLSGTMLGGACAVLPSAAALAACNTSGSDPVTIACTGNTTTANTTNSTSGISTTSRTQQFNADLIGTVANGALVDTFGLYLISQKVGGGINFTNNGTITAGGLEVLRLDGGGGNVVYQGTGTLTGTAANANGLVISNANQATVNITGGTITADGNTVRGMSVNTSASSTGGVSVTTHAGHTISVNNTASGSTNYGIEAVNAGTAGNVSVTSGAINSSGIGNVWGIGATNNATNGSITVTNNGAIQTTGGGTGILMTNNGGGNSTANVNANVTATSTNGAAIHSENQAASTGSVKVLIGAGVAVSGASGFTLAGTTGASHEVSVGAGGSLIAAVQNAISMNGTSVSLALSNAGTIAASDTNSGADAIVTYNLDVTSNSGTIRSAGGGNQHAALRVANELKLNNTSTGLITGKDWAIISGATTGTNAGTIGTDGSGGNPTTVVGMQVQGVMDFTNTGTIRGTTFGVTTTVAGAKLVNSGTITSGNRAVAFTGSNNTLELRAGTNITGIASGGIGGSNNVLELGGSGNATFNASNIDTGANTQQYQDFTTFRKSGTSNWTLSGTGAQNWAVSGGTLTGTTTSASGNMVMSNGANFAFDQAGNGTYSSVISGAGNLIKAGSGTVTLGVAQTYTGTTTVNGGTLQLGGTNFLPVGTTVTVNPTGAFNLGGFAQTVVGVTLAGGAVTNGSLTGPITSTGGSVGGIAGSTSLTANSGTTLMGTGNAYTGATVVNSGATLQGTAANAFSAASATTVNTGGAINFGGFAHTINSLALAGGAITNGSLAGAVTSTGGSVGGVAGSMSLTANSGTTQMGTGNAYTGATVVNSGATLQGTAANAFSAASATTVNTGGTINFGGFAHTINGLALAGGTLTNGSLAGAITSTGGTINGLGGSTTLTTTSGTTNINGTNTFSGLTSVNGGLLSVNGSMTGPITVNAGGTLGGTGTAGPTTINGGTLAPGNSIGTIQIAGNLSFVGAGNYVVEVSPTNADRTNVTGTASLGGTIQFIPEAGAYTIGTRYTVLNATGGVSGTFSATTFSGTFGGSVNPRVEYDANNVYLLLAPNSISQFFPGGTRNQRAVVGAIDTALAAGNVPPLFLGLFNLTTAQLPGALDQLSGEVHATTQGMLVDESLYARSAILGRLRQAAYGGNTQMASLAMGGPQSFTEEGTEAIEGALAYGKSPIVTKAPPMQAGPDVVFWAQGFGAKGRFDGDGNATNVRRDLAGFFSGVDTRVADGRLGIAAGYTGSRNNLDGRGSSNVETGHIAGYGGWGFGALNLRAGGDFAWHQIDTSRNIVFPGFFDTATASYKGRTGQIFGEAGYGFAFNNVAVEPFAGGAWVHLSTDGFTERALVAGLNGAANSFEVGYSNIGIRAASMIPLANDMMLVPRGSVSWQHAFNDVTPDGRLAFIAAPVPFVVAGTPIARDAILGEAGLDLAFGRSATIGVSYTGQLARNVQDHAAKGKFSWKF